MTCATKKRRQITIAHSWAPREDFYICLALFPESQIEAPEPSMHQDIRLAIIVNPSLSLGLLANTVGALSIGLGAKFPSLGARQLTDRQGLTIDISADRPVPVLQAEATTIRLLMLKAMSETEGRAVVPFPTFARSLHAFADYEAAFPNCDLTAEPIDGLGLAGPSKWVKSLTGSLKLLR